ncbi:MCE family protein [Nocardia rhizosphaerihabitans]|uniref:MCE family protein n=1 Tax=Nocardia rhizosphaerihabitans TaxID=1691570 RepID=UPI00366AF402
MLLSRLVRYQLIAFATITVLAVAWIGMKYLRVPAMLGIGRNTVELVLPAGGGLYAKSNVTYRGVHVGVVDNLRVHADTVVVTMFLDAAVDIPKTDIVAEVHSRSAIGEQYIELLPQTDSGPYLNDGDTIVGGRLPTPTDELIDTLDSALGDVPRGDLRVLIDESGTAFRNRGNDLQQILDGTGAFMDEGLHNIGPTRSLIDGAGPLLATQVASAESLHAWSGYLGSITRTVADGDAALRSLIDNGGQAGESGTALFTDIRATLPRALGNLGSLADVLRIYNMSVEQILVIYPAVAAAIQSITAGSEPSMGNLDFNLDINVPPPCTTGFLPPSERRSAEDSEPIPLQTPAFCAVPQHDPTVVRGARNLPCIENPGRRAPTVEQCKDPGGYVPLGENTPLETGEK